MKKKKERERGGGIERGDLGMRGDLGLLRGEREF